MDAKQAREVMKKMVADNLARGYGIDTAGVRYPIDSKGVMTAAETESRLLAGGFGR
jgi:hypothetical protein